MVKTIKKIKKRRVKRADLSPKLIKIDFKKLVKEEDNFCLAKKEKDNTEKEKKSLVLPLYFGWGLKLSLVRLSESALNFTSKIFKRKYWKEAMALLLLVAVVSSSLWFFQKPQKALGATYNWQQASWAGGATTTAATHSANQSGWTYYESASTTLTIGAELTLSTTTASTTQTSSSDFNGGATSSTVVSDGNIVLDQGPWSCGGQITFTYNATSVTYGTVSRNSSCWMDRNLGASRVAIGVNDSQAYGDYFQWGRLVDGHQISSSNTTTTLSSSDTPGHSIFILNPSSAYDWRNPKNDNLWQGISGINNPCPAGWRIPTSAELTTEKNSWSQSNYNGAYGSTLKFVTAGGRSWSSGLNSDTGKQINIWGSTVSGNYAYFLYAYSSSAGVNANYRALGLSVRCIGESYTDPSVTYQGTYYATGTFVSSVINITNLGWGMFDWSTSTLASTSVSFKVRTSDDSSMTGATDFSSCNAITKGSDISSNNCVTDGQKYIQYQVTLATTNGLVTPSVQDVTINYNTYNGSGSLISSPYNTGDSANVLASINWSETQATGTDVKFQVRTSSDNLTWTDWYGPNSTADYFTDPSGGESVTSTLSDGSQDQWLQYRATLESDGAYTPTLSDATMVYVVNAPPSFDSGYGTNGVVITATSSAEIGISYSVLDSDTNTGSLENQYKIWPSFEYSLDGISWSAITTSTVGATDYDYKTVATGTYSTYYAAWNAKSQLGSNTYAATATIRVKANDHEAANNIALATSSTFALDTKSPTLGSVPVFIDASKSPAVVTLSATDDSSLQMKISLNSDLSGASWQTYNSTSSITLASDPDIVYVQFRDAYNNTTTIQSATTPTTPTNIIYQDISNIPTSEWREFVAWSVVSEPTPGFGKYKVYRSEGGDYSLVSSSTNRTANYIVDASLSSGTTYRYKIATEDANGNISYFSSVVSDDPNGSGGSDLSSPSISAVATSSLTTDSVTVTWTTDELSNSTVGYSENPGDFSTEQGVASMVTSHSVTLSNLTPATTYYFQVKSTDPSGNYATDTVSTGYTFTTNSGPIISDVAVQETSNNSATIVWTTNTNADSYVVYSTSSSLSGSLESGNTSPVTSHSVSVSGLTIGQKYYFYVKSTAGSVTAYDKNVVEGVINYYSFNTTNDITGPSISSITSVVNNTSSVITWTTDEDSTSKVEYGSTDSYGSNSEDTTLTKIHAITLSDLSSGAVYHFRVISTDTNSNTATSSDYTFTTSNLGETEIVTQIVYTGGGGGGAALDNTPPGIFSIETAVISQSSVKIKWQTDEDANSIIEYGQTEDLGGLAGSPAIFSTFHEVTLKGLSTNTDYYYKIVSLDKSGNKKEEGIRVINISGDGSTLTETENPIDTNGSQEADSSINQTAVLAAKTGSESLIEKIFDAILENPFLKNVDENKITASVSEIANFAISPVVITGDSPKLEVGSSWATFEWVTDKNSNSLVALAKNTEYDPTKEDPYTKEEGKSGDSVTVHKIQVTGLDPSTQYHYQLRSEPLFGPQTKSQDLTFKTLSLALDIYNISLEKDGSNSAKISWQTNLPTKTVLEYTDLSTGQIKTKEDNNFLADHNLTVDSLAGQSSYSFVIKSSDENGNEISSPAVSFSTGEDKNPPQISQVKVDSAISPQGDKVQVIISWKTDELSTSRVAYQEGIAANSSLIKETAEDKILTTNHVVVISAFSPATVYRFNVISEDAAKNKTTSEDFTILTPQKKQTIIDIISDQFGQIFGWTKNFGF